MNRHPQILIAIVAVGVLIGGWCACGETDGPMPGEQFSPYNRLVLNFTQLVEVRYADGAATIGGPGAAFVTAETEADNAARLTLHSEADGIAYFVYGRADDGQLRIRSERPFALYLNNATLHSTEGPVIDCRSDEACYLVLCDGSTNNLSDSTEYPIRYDDDGMMEEDNACLYARGRLYFDGKGTLNVTSIGTPRYETLLGDTLRIHGISAIGGIESTQEAKINVTATGGDALHAEDSTVLLSLGTFTLSAGGSGICNTAGPVIIAAATLQGTASGGSFVAAPSGTGLSVATGSCFAAATAPSALAASEQAIWQAQADSIIIQADSIITAYVGNQRIASLTPQPVADIAAPWILLSTPSLIAGDTVTISKP